MAEQVELASVTLDIGALRGLLEGMQDTTDEYGLGQPGSNTNVTLRPNGQGDVTIIVQEVRFSDG